MLTFSQRILFRPHIQKCVNPLRCKIMGILNFSICFDNFTPEERVKILQTFNESTPENLVKYKINNAKLHGILEWKKQNGCFESLEDILKIPGFGEKSLGEICQNIAYDRVDKVKPKPSRSNKKLRNFLVPEMDFHLGNSLTSVTAIHLDLTGISWAKLNRDCNTLIEWKYKDFSSLPTKMSPLDTFNLAIDIVRKTPPSDAYIFESPPSLSPQSKTKQTVVSTHNQTIELLSMLFAMLNTSPKHNEQLQKLGDLPQKFANKVHYLRSRLTARIFNTLMGYEKVSSIPLVTGFINRDPKVLQTIPCTPVNLEVSDQKFLSLSAGSKELMAQSLMLAVTFMDLCIYKTPATLNALRPNRTRE